MKKILFFRRFSCKKKLYFSFIVFFLLFYITDIKSEQSYFFSMPSFIQCKGKDDTWTEFSFGSATRKNNQYSQEQEMDNLIGRFCRQCKQRDADNIPQSVFIGLAREMVNSDDEYKAQQTYVRFMLFKYPWLSYAGVAVAAFGVGALTHYAFS